MKCVNWYEYMKNPYVDQSKSISDKTQDDKHWKDLITENEFIIKNETLIHLINSASGFILQLIKANKFDELFEYFNGISNEYDYKKDVISYDVWLYPQLPYKSKNNEVSGCTRLMDYLSLRTGLLYSISGVKDKEKIRKISYLTGIREYLNEKEAKQYITKLLDREEFQEYKNMLEDVDNVLNNNNELGENIKNKSQKYKVDLVKGGVVKVKEYLLETNKIKEIRGASILLDRINREVIPKYIEEKFIRECIVYAGGGNILIIIPKDEGEKLAKEIEKTYEITTIIAQSVSVSKEITLYDICEENYSTTIRIIQDSLNERQMSKIDFRTKDYVGNLESININSDTNEYLEYHGEEILCDSCNMRLVEFKLKDGKKLCTSCLHKNLVGGSKAKKSFKEEYEKYVKNKGENIVKSKVDNLEDIKSENTNSIGVIYGDGNNMGLVIKKVRTMLQMKYFSDKTENSILEKVVYGAIANNIKVKDSVSGNIEITDKFEIIALGGDDIFIIVPEEEALSVSKDIGERFDAVFNNYSDKGDNNLTMSLGVTIAKYNKPVQYLFDMSMQLLKQAKKKAKIVKKGTMDILVLETDAGFASSVKFIRNKLISKEKVCTLRPYTYSEVETMISIINKLKNANGKHAQNFRSKAYKLMDATLSMNIEEANLYYSYQRVRLEECERQELDSIYSILEENYDVMNNKKLFIKTKNKEDNISIWLDVVELWDYVSGGEISG